MIGQILVNTPSYVWMLLAALITIGALQLRQRTAPLWRLVLIPMLFSIYALYSVATGFSHGALAVTAWLAGFALLTGLIGLRRSAPAGAAYDAARDIFVLPGTALPLAVIMVAFSVNYALGVMRAMAPTLIDAPLLTIVCSALLGACLGLFVGRMLTIVALRSSRPASA